VFGFAVDAPGASRYLPSVLAGLGPSYLSTTAGEMSETLPVPRFLLSNAITTRKPDLLWQNDALTEATVWHMGGTHGNDLASWTRISGAAGWKLVASADFDRDGVRDVVWQNSVTRQLTVWYMGGAQGDTATGWNWISTAGVPGWTVVGAGDFNGDTHPDLVLQNVSTRQVTVWYMGGAQGNTMMGWNWLHLTGISGWKIAAVADFNHDSRPDLVWQNESTGQATLWYMTGAQGNVPSNWTWVSSGGTGGWSVAGAADFDGDNVPDLIWQNDVTRQATVWYMGNNGSVLQSWSPVAGPLPGWKIGVVN
jgi:hypothetical protein